MLVIGLTESDGAELRGIAATARRGLDLFFEEPSFDTRLAQIATAGPWFVGALAFVGTAVLGSLLAADQKSERIIMIRLGATRRRRFQLGIAQMLTWTLPTIAASGAGVLAVFILLSRNPNLVFASAASTTLAMMSGVSLGVAFGAWRILGETS